MSRSITQGTTTSLSARVGGTSRRARASTMSLESRIAEQIQFLHKSDVAQTGLRAKMGHMYDLQNITLDEQSNIDAVEDGVVSGIEDAITAAVGDEQTAATILNDLTPAQVDAAVVAASAFGSQENAMESFRAMSTGVERPAAKSDAWSRTTVQEYGGGMGYTETSAYSAEAYDARNLTSFVGDTVTFNLQAARQRPFGEALYPTITLTPDQTGLDLTIRRTMVLNAKRHAYTGKFEDFNRRNIIDALVDYTVLADASTTIVPCYDSTKPDSVANFAPGLTPVDHKVADGVVIKTAPLRVGQQIDLIGIGQNPIVNAGGQLNQTDAIDNAVWLNSIVVKLGNAAGSLVDNFDLNVRGLANTQFIKTPNGPAKRVNVNFVTEDLQITAASLNYDKVTSPALAFMQTAPYNTYVIRLAVSVAGNLDLETGRLEVNSGTARIGSVLVPDGENGLKELEDATQLAEIQTKLGGQSNNVFGYRLDATYSNVNRREAGIFINVYEERTLYVVPLGAPITLQTPTTNTRTNADMAAPIAAARARNENNAVTQLFRFYEQLKNIQPLLSYGERRCKSPDIEGMGHAVVYPYVETIECDLSKTVQGIKSSDRMLDVAATLTNTIRDLSYNMWIKSFYQAAAENYGGQVVKPTLIIATDQEIERHLMDVGDTRLAGIYFDYQVVSTLDLRMRGKIVLAFQRPTTGRADPLAFGCMAFIPELVTTLNTSREGQLSRETMVQPRVLHVNTCPIMGVIEVKGIRPAVTGRVNVPMNLVS